MSQKLQFHFRVNMSALINLAHLFNTSPSHPILIDRQPKLSSPKWPYLTGGPTYIRRNVMLDTSIKSKGTASLTLLNFMA